MEIDSTPFNVVPFNQLKQGDVFGTVGPPRTSEESPEHTYMRTSASTSNNCICLNTGARATFHRHQDVISYPFARLVLNPKDGLGE